MPTAGIAKEILIMASLLYPEEVYRDPSSCPQRYQKYAAMGLFSFRWACLNPHWGRNRPPRRWATARRGPRHFRAAWATLHQKCGKGRSLWHSAGHDRREARISGLGQSLLRKPRHAFPGNWG